MRAGVEGHGQATCPPPGALLGALRRVARVWAPCPLQKPPRQAGLAGAVCTLKRGWVCRRGCRGTWDEPGLRAVSLGLTPSPGPRSPLPTPALLGQPCRAPRGERPQESLHQNPLVVWPEE